MKQNLNTPDTQLQSEHCLRHAAMDRVVAGTKANESRHDRVVGVAVEAIFRDLAGRSGFKQLIGDAVHDGDAETLEEMKEIWRQIVSKAYTSLG